MSVREKKFDRVIRRRVVSILIGLAMTAVGAVAVAPAAHAATIMIDNFSGTVLGTRTTTALPLPQTSTTPPGTFTESGGFGTFNVGGAGNGIGGYQLRYNFTNRDLTDGGLNNQFFAEFASIQRTPNPHLYYTALSITIKARDSSGVVGTYNTGVNSTGQFNIVLNMFCSPGQSSCFTPQPNFASINQIEVEVMFPSNHHYDSSTTAILDTIRTTPAGGAVPPRPAVSVNVPTANPTYGTSATPINVTIPVNTTETITNHLSLSELSLTTTGTASAIIGSPLWHSGTKTYTVPLVSLNGNGTIRVSVAGGAIVDSWDQGNIPTQSSAFEYRTVTPPTFSGGASFTMVEGQAFSGQIEVTNNGPSVTIARTSGTLPPGVALNTSTGALTGTPTTRGAYNFTVTATNLAGSTERAYTAEVNAVPAFTSGATANFTVGQSSTFNVTTSGRPNSTVAVQSGSVPAGLSFTAGANGTATISGTATAPGTSTVTLRATNSAGFVDQILTINRNQVPIFVSPPASATLTVAVPASIDLPFTAFPVPTASITGGTPLPGGLNLSVVGGNARISGTPTLAAAGTHNVTVRLTNSQGSADHAITLVVGGPAEITSANTATVTVGEPLSFQVTADGIPKPSIAVTGLPTGLSFTDNGGGTGDITGSVAQTGTYTATVTASNTSGPDAVQTLTIRVVEGPAITSANATTFTRGEASSFTVTTTGYPTATLTRVGTLPSGVAFTEHGNGTATISGTPTEHGTFPITLRAENPDFPAVMQSFTLTVEGAPVFGATPDRTAQTGVATSFAVSTSALPIAGLSATGLPAGLTATDNEDGTITVAGTPAPGTGGTYQVDLTATNSVDTTTAGFTLTVNQPPVITSVAAATFTRGSAGSFQFTSTGFPAATVSVTGTLPDGVTLGTSSGGSLTISGTPTEHGVFPLTITATNGIGTAATQSFTLTVLGAPVFGATPDRTAQTGVATSFAVSTSALPIAELSATGLPAGLTATDNEDGTITVAGTPAPGTGGTYQVDLTATNSVDTTTAGFTLTVNQPPAITSVAAATFTRGSAGSFQFTSTGFPAATVAVTGALPDGVTLGTSSGGSLTISGTPTEHGVFPLTITATNGIGTAATQSFTLTVQGAPLFDATPDRTAQTGVATSFAVSTSALPVAELSATGLPAGLTATDNEDGTITVAGTPAPGTGGTYQVDLTATNSVDTTTAGFTLTVNQPPAITTADEATFTRGEASTFDIATSGYPIPAVSAAGALPAGITFADNGDGTATIAGTPTEDGVFPLAITADNGIGDDAIQAFTLRVHGEAPFTGTATVTGTGTAGSALTVESTIVGTAPGSTVTGQWLRDGVAIAGATDDTWTPTNADAGAVITYRVAISAPSYVPVTVDSTNSVSVVGVITVGDLSVTGDRVVDEVLAADLSGIDPAEAVVAYEWTRAGDVIGTEAEYTPVPQDVDQTLTVTATVTLANFHTRTVDAAVGPIGLASFTELPGVSVSGTAQVGETLTAVATDSDPAATETTYAWFADGAPIAGEAGPTLALPTSLKGKSVAAQVTVSRPGYATESVRSPATAAVATNLAPKITLRISKQELRRGGTAVLRWETVEADKVTAAGAWSGSKSTTGTVTVKPTALGRNTYRIVATNHIGSTTAQVVVNVKRSKAKLKVKVPKNARKVGKRIKISATGLDPFERFTVRIGARKVGKGRANARGIARATVRIPKTRKNGTKIIRRTHVRVFGELGDRQGKSRLKVTRKHLLAAKKLRVTVRSATVRASGSQVVRVRGLGAREKVVVTVNGARVSGRGARATKTGTFRLVIPNVGVTWGSRAVRVEAIGSKRKASARFTVISRNG